MPSFSRQRVAAGLIRRADFSRHSEVGQLGNPAARGAGPREPIHRNFVNRSLLTAAMAMAALRGGLSLGWIEWMHGGSGRFTDPAQLNAGRRCVSKCH